MSVSTRGLSAPLSIQIVSGSTLKADMLKGLQLSLRRAGLSSAFETHHPLLLFHELTACTLTVQPQHSEEEENAALQTFT